MSGWIVIIIIGAMVAGGLVMWLLLRPDRRAEAEAASHVEDELALRRREIEDAEGAKTSDERWETLVELTNDDD